MLLPNDGSQEGPTRQGCATGDRCHDHQAQVDKHKLTLSDEETVLQIQENTYLQYFIGFSSYKDQPPFAPSLFVDIRKRIGVEVFTEYRVLGGRPRLILQTGHFPTILDLV